MGSFYICRKKGNNIWYEKIINLLLLYSLINFSALIIGQQKLIIYLLISLYF